MPIFVSYSHADSEFANKLAAHLVKANELVWVDTWELNVGDSIIQRVQDAIKESGALLVILSKSSVESEWCKKEISAGLMRELDEKRVIVLPVLVEDCEIPTFLREKMYADFRSNFDSGLKSILDAVGKVTNPNQGRLEEEEGYVDWAMDWGYEGEFFTIRFTMVYSSNKLPMTVLTEVSVLCDEVLTARYEQYVDAGIDWLGRAVIAEALYDIGQSKEIKLLLDDQFPKTQEITSRDEKKGASYKIRFSSRKMGQDTGKDQLISVSGYLISIRDYVRSVTRQPNPEEQKELLRIVGTPFKK